MLGVKSGPNVVIDFASPDLERQAIDTTKLPTRGEIIARLLTGGGRRLPDAPSPHSVLMRSLMRNRPDFERDLGPADILLIPPIPPGVGPLDWHRHRELRAMARAYSRAELARLAEEGHAQLVRGRAG
jgi:hypothetical protein